jgi:hypothetical protein
LIKFISSSGVRESDGVVDIFTKGFDGGILAGSHGTFLLFESTLGSMIMAISTASYYKET